MKKFNVPNVCVNIDLEERIHQKLGLAYYVLRGRKTNINPDILISGVDTKIGGDNLTPSVEM